MRKIMRIGTIKTHGGGHISLYIKAEYSDNRLSISGVIGPSRSGNAYGGCGQIDMEFAHRKAAHNDSRYSQPIQPREINFAPEWNAKKWLDLLEIWHDWHLNDLKPGCEHQRASGWEDDGYDVHPSEPCPTCGYKFGTAWHKLPIPQRVLDTLLTFPDTDREPAWC